MEDRRQPQVPDRVHDQPAEGGREEIEELLEQDEAARAQDEEDRRDEPPRAGLENVPVDDHPPVPPG